MCARGRFETLQISIGNEKLCADRVMQGRDLTGSAGRRQIHANAQEAARSGRFDPQLDVHLVKASVSPVAALKERLVRWLNRKRTESAYELAHIVFANPSRTFPEKSPALKVAKSSPEPSSSSLYVMLKRFIVAE